MCSWLMYTVENWFLDERNSCFRCMSGVEKHCKQRKLIDRHVFLLLLLPYSYIALLIRMIRLIASQRIGEINRKWKL